MTKKSMARVMRDEKKKEVTEYFKTNTVFDDLMDIHQKITANIAQFGMISQLASNQELIDLLDDKASVNININLLAKDLNKIIKDLNDTFESHKDKRGGATDPDEYMWALTVFQNYSQITSVVDGAVIPTVATIYEEFAKAEKKLIEIKKNNETNEEVKEEVK